MIKKVGIHRRRMQWQSRSPGHFLKEDVQPSGSRPMPPYFGDEDGVIPELVHLLHALPVERPLARDLLGSHLVELHGSRTNHLCCKPARDFLRPRDHRCTRSDQPAADQVVVCHATLFQLNEYALRHSTRGRAPTKLRRDRPSFLPRFVPVDIASFLNSSLRIGQVLFRGALGDLIHHLEEGGMGCYPGGWQARRIRPRTAPARRRHHGRHVARPGPRTRPGCVDADIRYLVQVGQHLPYSGWMKSPCRLKPPPTESVEPAVLVGGTYHPSAAFRPASPPSLLLPVLTSALPPWECTSSPISPGASYRLAHHLHVHDPSGLCDPRPTPGLQTPPPPLRTTWIFTSKRFSGASQIALGVPALILSTGLSASSGFLGSL